MDPPRVLHLQSAGFYFHPIQPRVQGADYDLLPTADPGNNDLHVIHISSRYLEYYEITEIYLVRFRRGETNISEG